MVTRGVRTGWVISMNGYKRGVRTGWVISMNGYKRGVRTGWVVSGLVVVLAVDCASVEKETYCKFAAC